MRFLGVGDYHSLGEMYRRLALAGHEVRVYVAQAEAHEIFSGIVTRCESWQQELDWIRAAGNDGIIICETAGWGAQQDALRAEGFQVIGGSAYGDRLENDRAFGQSVMRDAGMQTAPSYDFNDFETASDFVARHPARYVYKLSDGDSASTRNYVGEMDNGADIRALLQLEQRRRSRNSEDKPPHFVLMKHVQGVEVGVGAYFNGEEFLHTVCLDWEHKRLFPGDLGELTGEMGTVVTYRGAGPLFEASLARMAPQLRSAGYLGYINLNTILNDEGIWPLEFTCRFGYPGFAICDALHDEGWDTIFRTLLERKRMNFKTHTGFAVGVVLTVPPFPHEQGYAELSKGAPIFYRRLLTDQERNHLYYGEVGLRDGQEIMSGSLGFAMVATGCGRDVVQAQAAAYELTRQVVIPNLRYRNDIGDKLIREDLSTLSRLGYWKANEST